LTILIRNDKGFDLLFQILKANNTPVDISTATVTFKMAKSGASSNKINQTCTVTDGPNGKCKYPIRDGDLTEEGTYLAELQVAFTPEIVQTAVLEKIVVVADLP
jgi:hypothetical protein